MPDRESGKHPPVLLVVMDGFGMSEPGPGNAISLARTPNLDELFRTCPWTTLEASGQAVGLPDGQMGNSEVGHLNIGAGRIVYQELTRIDRAIEDGSLAANPVLIEAIDGAITDAAAVHFMGLLSDGGVHSHQEHLYALLRMAAERGADRVYVHAFLDGRDVPPASGCGYIENLERELKTIGTGRIATVMGRYYAMDRDNRWERVEQAWRAIALGEGDRVSVDDTVIDLTGRDARGVHSCACSAVLRSYTADITDEFVLPTVILDEDAVSAPIEDGDALIFFNFRPDRAREISRAFVDPEFVDFKRPVFPNIRFVCLTEYDPALPAPVAFSKDLPECVLADVVAAEGLRQLHIAETEKYAHVTFFLNGGIEVPKPGEERILVPSPQVPTYDMQPEMSAPEVTRKLVEAIQKDSADLYVVNYANCDMVGHTGVISAAVKAVEAVDDGIGQIVQAIKERGGSAIITADHGNADCMLDPETGGVFTAHTLSPVPFICVAERVSQVLDGGCLADVAPSVCDLMDIERPAEWTGRSLVVRET